MARSAIPDWGTEYPEYVHRAWPKYVGLDETGEALIAKDDEEYRRLKEIAVFPKVLGKDRDGKEVVAQNERDEEWLASKVVKDTNSLTGEIKRGPGRPPKFEAA